MLAVRRTADSRLLIWVNVTRYMPTGLTCGNVPRAGFG